MQCIVDHHQLPPTCLPEALFKLQAGMRDVTKPNDTYRVLVDLKGNIHDGAVYFKRALELALLRRNNHTTEDSQPDI